MKDRFVKNEDGKVKLSRSSDNGFTKIEVPNDDFNASGNPAWWVIEDDAVRRPTPAELTQREEAREAEEIERKLRELWDTCYKYQLENIDLNTENELGYARTLVSQGVDPVNFPKCVELGNWKKALYGLPNDVAGEQGTYYARKNALLAGQVYSLDFSDHDPVPHSYQDLAIEIATFEASM